MRPSLRASQTVRHRRLAVNSDESESWHSWCSSGRWFVFSSKRFDGLFARPHFAYVDRNGRVGKPFVLPQRDPAFYDSCFKTYNIPGLVRGPVPVRGEAIGRVIRSADWVKVNVPVACASAPARAAGLLSACR